MVMAELFFAVQKVFLGYKECILERAYNEKVVHHG